MAKAKKVQTRVANWKKKKLFAIHSDGTFNNTLLGETMVEDASSLRGRGLESNLMVLTGDMKKQNVNVTFRITSVEGSKAVAVPVGYNLASASIRRMVRRGRDRVDLSFVFKTKDEKNVRIKPIIITKNRTSKSVLTALRKNCIALLLEMAKTTTYSQFMNSIVQSKLQRELQRKLKKVYPLRTVDIKGFCIEVGKKEEFNVEEVEAPEQPVQETKEAPKEEAKPEAKKAEAKAEEAPATESSDDANAESEEAQEAEPSPEAQEESAQKAE